jgi:hypothetical protein
MTSQQLDGDEEISLLDEAVVKYHAKGLDFIELLDQYLNYRAPSERYVFSTPKLLLLAELAHDDEHGYFWYVLYAAARGGENPVAKFMEFAPYKLDTVAFARYRSMGLDTPDKIKHYNWNRLERLVNYGRKQITTTTTPSTTTPSTTSPSSPSPRNGG